MDDLHAMAPGDAELLGFALDRTALSEPTRAHVEQCGICRQRLANYKQVNARIISQFYRRLCPGGTQLSFYCADLLPPGEKTHIAAHVLDCPPCAAEVADTRRFITDVRIDDLALPDSMPSPAQPLRPASTPRKELQHRYQDTCSNESNEHTAPEVIDTLDVQKARQVPTNNGTNETDNDISNTTIASPAYDSTGKETRD